MSRTIETNEEYYLYQIQGKYVLCRKFFLRKHFCVFLFCIVSGARRYLMKEPDSTIPACKRRLLKIMILDRFMRFILFGFIFYRIFKAYNLFGFGELSMEKHNDTIIEKFL